MHGACADNLDVEAQLYEGTSLVLTVNPTGAVNADVTYSGTAGQTYALRIDGVGEGNVLGTGECCCRCGVKSAANARIRLLRLRLAGPVHNYLHRTASGRPDVRQLHH